MRKKPQTKVQYLEAVVNSSIVIEITAEKWPHLTVRISRNGNVVDERQMHYGIANSQIEPLVTKAFSDQIKAVVDAAKEKNQ